MPFWEWPYNNPWYTLRYYHNYYFGEWNICLKGGLPPFPSPHLTMNGYPYRHKWFSDFDGRCRCWFDLHKYGVLNINDNNTCNNDGCSRKDMIIHQMNTKSWFHSLCYWDIWMSSFSFWLLAHKSLSCVISNLL